jgi:hypothetical protein
LKVHTAVGDTAQIIANLLRPIGLDRLIGAGNLIDELRHQIHRRQDHHEQRHNNGEAGAQSRIRCLLKNELVNRKEDIGQNACQDDVRQERQRNRNTEDRDRGKQNRKKNALLSQWILPYIVLALETA